MKENTEKTLLIITHGPAATLGDPSSSSLLIKQLLIQHPDLKIKFYICSVSAEHYLGKRGVIPQDERVTVYFSQNSEIYELPFEQEHNILLYLTGSFLAQYSLGSLLKSKANIMLGTAYSRSESPWQKNLFTQIDRERLEKLRKQTHLSSRDLTDKEILEEKETFLDSLNARVHFLYAGLAKDATGAKRLGINIAPMDRKEPSIAEAFSILPQKDKETVRFILDNKPWEEYQQSSQLYFGYYNNINSVADTNKATAARFFRLAVKNSFQKKPDQSVDIVMPLKSEDQQSWEAIVGQFDLAAEDLSLEYWKQEPKTNTYILEKKEGRGKRTVRIINPFPLSPQGMAFMFQFSHPFCMVTGNQSCSEALSFNKLFFYQIMSWEREFYTDIKSHAKDLLGEHAAYCIFLELLESDNPDDEDALIDLLHNHLAALLQNAKDLHAYFYQEYNLEENIVETIYNQLTEAPIVENERWHDLSWLDDYLKHKESEFEHDWQKRADLKNFAFRFFQSSMDSALCKPIRDLIRPTNGYLKSFLSLRGEDDADVYADMVPLPSGFEVWNEEVLKELDMLREEILKNEVLVGDLLMDNSNHPVIYKNESLPLLTYPLEESLQLELFWVDYLGLTKYLPLFKDYIENQDLLLTEDQYNALMMIALIVNRHDCVKDLIAKGASPNFSIEVHNKHYSPLVFALNNPLLSRSSRAKANLPLLEYLCSLKTFDFDNAFDALKNEFQKSFSRVLATLLQPQVIECLLKKTNDPDTLFPATEIGLVCSQSMPNIFPILRDEEIKNRQLEKGQAQDSFFQTNTSEKEAIDPDLEASQITGKF